MVLLIISTCNSQVKVISGRPSFKQGNFEFSFSANVGESSRKSKDVFTYYDYYDSSYKSNSYNSSDGAIYVQIGASLGYYLIDGLSIEPELNLNIPFAQTSISLIGNLCYTFSVQQKNIYPYIKAGYGISNYNTNTSYSQGLFDKLDFKTINVGAGLKFIYTSGMALRMEINYKNMKGSTSSYNSYDYYMNSTNRDVNISILSLSIGISIII